MCVLLTARRTKNSMDDELERLELVALGPRRPPTDCCSRAIAGGNEEVGKTV